MAEVRPHCHVPADAESSWYRETRLDAEQGRVRLVADAGHSWDWPIGELGVFEIVWVARYPREDPVKTIAEVALDAGAAIEGRYIPRGQVPHVVETIALLDPDGQAMATLGVAGWDQDELASFAREAGLRFRKARTEGSAWPIVLETTIVLEPPMSSITRGYMRLIVLGVMAGLLLAGVLIVVALLLHGR
jgi:hypothetical protein